MKMTIKLKRLLSILLALLVLCGSIASLGCTVPDAEDEDRTVETVTATTESETDAVPTAEPTTEVPAETPSETTPEPTVEPTSEPTPVPTVEPTVEPTVAPTPAPTPEPVFVPCVEEVTGWHKASVTLRISITDVNCAGYDKVVVCTNKCNSTTYADVTKVLGANGYAEYVVNANGRIFVLVTDKAGVVHESVFPITFFDFTEPSVRAGVSDTLLHVEASDQESGLGQVYVNDNMYCNLESGVLDLRIDDLTSIPTLHVQAEDNVGNRSKMVIIVNPFYVDPNLPKPTPQPQAPASTTSPHVTTVTQPAATPVPTAAPTQPVEIDPGQGFSESGSAVTRDLLYDKHTNKQFITVKTRNGETFYLVIDYDKPTDKDGEQYETYFLNLVDEADLLALVDDSNGAVTIAKCTCTDKCKPGAVNTTCEVCRLNMSECTGVEKVEPTPEPTATPEPEKDETDNGKSPAAALAAVLLLAVLGAGGAFYWFKLRQPKPDTKGNTDLDDYDYGDDDDEDDEDEYEYETDEESENKQN